MNNKYIENKQKTLRGWCARLGSSVGRLRPFSLLRPPSPLGSPAPSYPRSRWSRRPRRTCRAGGRPCPVQGRPALGRPGSGGSGGRQTPLRRAGTWGGREGGDRGQAAGTGQGRHEGRATRCLPVFEPHHGDFRSGALTRKAGSAGGQWEFTSAVFNHSERDVG